MRGANLSDRQFAHDGVNVAGKRVLPLLPMLRIAPASFISPDISLSNSLKGYSGNLGRLSRRKRLSGLPVAFCQRVDPGFHFKPQRQSQIAGICQRDAAMTGGA